VFFVQSMKCIVRRNLRVVISGINFQLFLHSLGSYFYFLFNGTPSLINMSNLLQRAKTRQISVVESMYRTAVGNLVYSSVPVSEFPVTAPYRFLAPQLVAQNLQCPLFFEAVANLIHQSSFLWLINAETSFIEFKGRCPFKFEKKYVHLKHWRENYRLTSLITHLSLWWTLTLIFN
jgi:hypothetical protein